MSDRIEAMAAELRESGYLVVKVPPCARAGTGHGKHSLITRTASCPGEEPMPHAFVNMHYGTFGPWYVCACGGSFRDHGADDEPTPWSVHKATYIDTKENGHGRPDAG
jgi:hypothetical protein